MMEENYIAIKAHFEGSSKNLHISKDLDYKSFLTALRGMFPKGFDIIKYRDEDGEIVTMGSAEEYEEAIKKVAPLVNRRLRVYLEKKGGKCFYTDAVNKKECNEGKDVKSMTSKPEIKRPPSFNMEDEFFLVPAAGKDMQKTKKKCKHGQNPVKYFSGLTKIILEEQKAQKATKNMIDYVKENMVVPPQNISADQELRQVLVDESKAENKEGIQSQEEKKSKQMPKKKPRKGRKRASFRNSRSSSSSNSESDSDTSEFLSESNGSTDSDSSSGSSSSGSSETSSESSSESESSQEEYEKLSGSKSNDDAKKAQEKKHRKKNRIRMMAKRISHCIAPDVCDEVENCMISWGRSMKKTLTDKMIVCVEESIKSAFIEHAAALVDKNSDASVTEKKNGKQVLYYHKNITCDGCDQSIYGPRYKCGNCADFDLCSSCEAKGGFHDETHVFIKIIKPAVNAGRKGGRGKMRPLLRENIYKLQDNEKLSNMKTENMEIEKAFNMNYPIKDADCMPEEPADKAGEDGKKPQYKVEDRELNKKNLHEEEVVVKETATAKVEFNEIDAMSAQKNADDKNQIAGDTPEPDQGHDDEKTEKNLDKSDSPANDHDTEEDDVIVVKQGKFVDQKANNHTPDLVDIDAESVSSNGSEDFIVVPKYFDLNSPLDESIVLQHKMTCNDEHHGQCFMPENMTYAPPVIDMDLVASTIKESSRPQPNGEPDITKPEISTGLIVEKQPDISPLAAADAVTVQPDFAVHSISNARPAADTEEPILLSKELPTSDKTNEQPLPVTKQPAAKDIEQPNLLIMHGRGVVPKVDDKTVVEPESLMMRDGVGAKSRAGDAMAADEVTPRRNEATKYESPSKMRDLKVDIGPIEGHQLHEISTRKTAPTWSPTPTDEVLSTADLLSETFHGLVNATASAAGAVYEGVSNALNTGEKLPKVKYQNERVIINPDDDKVEGIPRPLQTPQKDARPSMSANDILYEMGFFDRNRNEKLLKKYKGNIEHCVAELLSDNNWHTTRH